MENSGENNGSAPTPSLALGFSVLNLLIDSGHSLGVSQVASGLKIPKASAHRLLRTLCSLEFINQDPEHRRYSISPRIFGFFHHLTDRFRPNSTLVGALRNYSDRLHCSVYVSMIAGRSMFVISASGPYGDTASLGEEAPVYASSCGKAVLSQLPKNKWREFAPRSGDLKIGARTNLDPSQFIAEMDLARHEGVGWNILESAQDYCSVAAPIRERKGVCRLAAAIVLPYREWLARDRDNLKEDAQQLAAELSFLLNPHNGQ